MQHIEFWLYYYYQYTFDLFLDFHDSLPIYKTITVGDTFDPMAGVTAKDAEDGDLTDKIEVDKNTVDTKKAGK